MNTRTAKIHNLVNFAYLSALSVWLVIIVSFHIIKPAAEGLLDHHNHTANGAVTYSDFSVFYTAGELARSTENKSLYDPQVQIKHLKKTVGAEQLCYEEIIQSVPFFFILMIPFSLLPITIGHIIWDLVGLAFAIGALVLLTKQVSNIPRKQIPFLIVGILVSIPTMRCLSIGQTSCLMVGLCSLFYWAWYTNRDGTAGAALAVAALKPQYALFLIIPAVVGKRFKLILLAALIEGILLALTAAIIGWQNIWNYPHVLFQLEGRHQVGSECMISIRGPLSLFLSQEACLHLTMFISLLSACAIGFLSYHALYKSKSKEGIQWLIAISMLTGLIFSAHTHAYDAMLLGIAAVTTLPTLDVFALLRIKPMSFRIWCLILYAYPVLSWVLYLGAPSGVLRGVFFCLLHLLLLICALFYQLYMANRTHAPSAQAYDGGQLF